MSEREPPAVRFRGKKPDQKLGESAEDAGKQESARVGTAAPEDVSGAKTAPRRGKFVDRVSVTLKVPVPVSKSKFAEDTIGLVVRLSVLLLVWMLGWAGWSVLWLFLVVGGLMMWERKKRRALRRALMSEHRDDSGLILAHTNELPSWVNFPDVNRVEWINTIVERIWPHLEPAIKKVLVEKVEPLLQKKVPKPLKSISFQTVKLGPVSPKITGIKVYAQDSIDQKEIVMDVDVIFNGRGVLELFLKYGISAGISHVTVNGKLRIILKPLMPVLPLVGAISIFFLEKPVIDFELRGLANFLDLPVLRSAIDAAIAEKLADTIVFPSQLLLSFFPDVKNFDDLLYPEPSGFLCTTVVEAQDVEGMDFRLFSQRTSDLYVVVKVGRHQFQTSVIHDSVSAVWNETFEILLERHEEANVLVEVWDKEDLVNDQLIGSCQVPAVDVRRNSDLWLDIQADGVAQSRGRVRLVFYWCRIATAQASLPLIRQLLDMPAAPKVRRTNTRSHSLPAIHRPHATGERRRIISMPELTEGDELSSAAANTAQPARQELKRKRPSVIDRLRQSMTDVQKPADSDPTPFFDIGRAEIPTLLSETSSSRRMSARAALASTVRLPAAIGGVSGDMVDGVGVSTLFMIGEEDERQHVAGGDGHGTGDGEVCDGGGPPDASAVLLVRVIRAELVEGQQAEESDYFCRLRFDGTAPKVKTTDSVHATYSALWDASFHFSFAAVGQQTLRLEVCSKPDTLHGYFNVGLADLVNAKSLTSHGKFPLLSSGSGGEDGKEATVELRLSLRALVPDGLEGGASLVEDDDGSDTDLVNASFVSASESDKTQSPAVVNEEDEESILAPPARFPVRQVTDSSLELSFRYSHLKHRLFVNVHRASSLVACHIDGTSDPFVEAFLLPDSLGMGRRRTSTRRKNCNPVFNENFQYPIPFSHVRRLSVVLVVRNSPFRYGAFREHMGEVLVDLGSINFSVGDRVWYRLGSRVPDEGGVSTVDAVMGAISYALPS